MKQDALTHGKMRLEIVFAADSSLNRKSAVKPIVTIVLILSSWRKRKMKRNDIRYWRKGCMSLIKRTRRGLYFEAGSLYFSIEIAIHYFSQRYHSVLSVHPCDSNVSLSFASTFM